MNNYGQNLNDATNYGGMPKGNYAFSPEQSDYASMRISIEYTGKPSDIAKMLGQYGGMTQAAAAKYGKQPIAPTYGKDGKPQYGAKSDALPDMYGAGAGAEACPDPANCPHHGAASGLGGLVNRLFGSKTDYKQNGPKSTYNTKAGSKTSGSSHSNAYKA